MICKHQKFEIFDNTILVLGCGHKNIQDVEFDPTNADMYEILDDFQPTDIFVEMSQDTGFGKSGILDDITVIESFTDDMNTDYTFYDAEKNTYFDHMLMAMFDETHIYNDIMDEIDKETTINEINKKRSIIEKENSEFYNAVFYQREQKAINLIYSYLKEEDNKKLVIHCGLTHYPVYNSLFRYTENLEGETFL